MNSDRRPRVLLIEDHAETRRLVQHLLKLNYEVEAVPEGVAALQRVSSDAFDVLLVDINLGSGPNGVDLIHKIRTLDGMGHVPIVAVTAYALPGDRERFLEAGFDAYLSKPFTRQQLFDTLQRVLPPGRQAASSPPAAS